ncbi:NAD(P)H-dependent oxidoreductase [PVC group bacterium]|nr:NAD(P)H-dependent oxidoreductase [PVC group bacterium]
MRLLILRSIRRKGGYTQRFTDLFVQGAKDAGAELHDIDLTKKKIETCKGCYHCWLATPGKCVINDDAQELLEEIKAADVILCASPFYYYSMNSCMHTFLERTLPLTKAGLDTTPDGLFRNSIRYPDLWKEKSMIFLTVGALRNMANFNPFKDTCKLIADGLTMKLGGVLIRPESHLTGFPRVEAKTFKKIQSAFIEAGKAAALTGTVPEQTLQDASSLLSHNAPFFKEHSDVYWEKAVEMGSKALDLREVVAKVSDDVRPIFLRMETEIDPKAAKKVKAVIQFDFPDKNIYFRIAINCGTVRITQEETASPDLRITCNANLWVLIAKGKFSPREAIKNGDLTLKGDKSLFTRLPRFFPVVG